MVIGAPIETIKVSEGVLKRILELIRNGDLKPGDRLPSIQLFSKNMKVGAGSVREALKQLQIIGIVELKQGEGTFITDKVNAAHISSHIGYLLEMKKPDMQYCIEVRKIIERGAVALAAKRATENDIDRLDENIQKMKEKVNVPEEFAVENINFHLAIVEASKNPILIAIFNSICDLFSEEQRVVAEVLDLKSKSVKSHINIWKAIKSHNVDKAIFEMEKHLNIIQRAIS